VAASWQELETLFNRNKSSIFREYRKSLVEPNPSGRPASLHPDVATRLEWFITEEYSAHRPTPYKNITDHLESVEHAIINVGTLRHVIAQIPV
jgi:hypothetical protein